MTTRAQRRHHRARLKKARKAYWGFGFCGGGGCLSREHMDPRRLGMVINTPKPCSCATCGNRRFHEGVTLQERKAETVYEHLYML